MIEVAGLWSLVAGGPPPGYPKSPKRKAEKQRNPKDRPKGGGRLREGDPAGGPTPGFPTDPRERAENWKNPRDGAWEIWTSGHVDIGSSGSADRRKRSRERRGRRNVQGRGGRCSTRRLHTYGDATGGLRQELYSY